MKRMLLGLAVMMSCAFSMGLVGNPSSAEAGENCQAKVAGNSYDCDLKFSVGPPETDCFEFRAGGISANFTLTNGTGELGCTCATTGSFTSPSFNSSPSAFECIDGLGIELSGKIKSKKLSGQVIDEGGDSEIYACTLRSSPCP